MCAESPRTCVAVSLGLQVLALARLLSVEVPGLTAELARDIYLYLLFFASLTIVVHPKRESFVLGLAVGAKLILLLNMTVALGTELWAKQLLLTSLLCDLNAILTSGRAALLSATAVALYIREQFRLPGTSGPAVDELLPFAVLSLLSVLVLWLLAARTARAGELESNLEQAQLAVSELSEANLRIQDYAVRSGEKMVIHERQRIAREIHDSIGHAMVNIMMTMDAARAVAETRPERLRQLLDLTHEQAKMAMYDTRRATHELHDMHSKPFSGALALRKLFDVFEQSTGIRLEYDLRSLPADLDNERNLIVYRLVQEGLTNAFKHGKASHISIAFERNNGHLNVQVRDNGKLPPKGGHGLGLSGMAKRLTDLEGHLEAGPVNGGYQLEAVIPLTTREQPT